MTAITQHISDTSATASVVHVSITMPLEQARELADLGLSATLTATPSMLRSALGQLDGPRDRFSELDGYIAKVIDKHGPSQAGGIRTWMLKDHEHVVSDESVIRRRFGKGKPLLLAGYGRVGNAYGRVTGSKQ
ncbi:MAG: hypothetical protein KTR15_11670 [Phycisphaeraceae bacterium]|nr:hypothetical protein [Phycisphaeraceae bacterium]